MGAVENFLRKKREDTGVRVYAVFEMSYYSTPNVYVGTDYKTAKKILLEDKEARVMEIWERGELVDVVYDVEEEENG